MLIISQHAKERFAERIMDRNSVRDINLYITQNEALINERINKMVEFGEEIFYGKSVSEYNKSITKVYLKDTWVVIVDPAKNKVITLYSIDLGLGDEFNNDYINRLIEKLNLEKDKYNQIETDLRQQETTYNNIMNENESTINEYRRIINELEKQNNAYKDVISGINTQLDVAQQNIREVVGTLVGRKVY